MNQGFRVGLLAILGCATGSFAQGPAYFRPLGGFEPGRPNAEVWAISADGSTVAGSVFVTHPSNRSRAARYRLSDPGWVLADPEWETVNSGANGISQTGAVLVGQRGAHGYAWGPVPYHHLYPWADGGYAVACSTSYNGLVTAGYNDGPTSDLGRAIAWFASETPTNLGTLPGHEVSQGLGVSGDGTTIVGHSDGRTQSSAFRWTLGTGMVALDRLGPSRIEGAFAASANGAIVIGWSDATPVRWLASGAVESLGSVTFSPNNGYARAVSADGSVIVGGNAGSSHSGAFIWTADTGLRQLNRVLARDYGLDVRGWCLTIATGISADGRILVGQGYNPQGEFESWAAYLGDVNPTCDADWNLDGFVSGDDFDGFVSAFESGSRSADFNADCWVNGDDFDLFVASFEAGC